MVDAPHYWRNMTYQLFQFIRGIGGLLSAAMKKTVKKPILHMENGFIRDGFSPKNLHVAKIKDGGSKRRLASDCWR